MWEQRRRCYPLKLESISLILVILSFYIALSNYSSLPDTIPVNFDATGNPDNWGSKGWIILLLIVNVGELLFLTLINFWFAVVDDPRHFINLPRGRSGADVLTREQGEAIRVSMNRSLFVLKIIILGLHAYLTWQMVEIGLGRSSSMGPWPWLFIGALLIVVGYMVRESFRLTKTPT